MFVLGTDYGVDTEDEAIVACQSPPGCEALDTKTGEWIGPVCQEDIDAARARLEGRDHTTGDS